MLLEMMVINRPKSLHDAPDKPAAVRGVFDVAQWLNKLKRPYMYTYITCALFAASL